MQISHSSALSAAANATAEVSDPPRPNVVISPRWLTPWKPATIGMQPASNSARRATVSISWILALPCTLSVFIEIWSAKNDLAWTPMDKSPRLNKEIVTCSPEAVSTSISRALPWSPPMSWPMVTKRLVSPDIADTTTTTSWPWSMYPFMRCATPRIRSTSPTLVPPYFWTISAISCLAYREPKPGHQPALASRHLDLYHRLHEQGQAARRL